MSIFELPKGVRDLGSILNEYRPKKRRGNHTETDRAYDDFANPIDEESIGYPVEGNEVERSDPDSYYHEPSSPPMNPSTVSLRGRNDEPGHSRLDEIADELADR